MAFGTPVHLVSALNKTSATQLTLPMSGASVAGGSVFMILVILAFDNIGTAAGDNGDVTGVTDSGGNTYVKVGEMTNAGNAGAAVTTSVWMADAVNALTTTNAINVSFNGNTSAKVASAFKVPKSSTATLEVGASNSSSADGAATGQGLSVTPPDSREWFFVRVDGCEQTNDNGSAWNNTFSTGWTGNLPGTSTSGGGAASNMLFMAEYDIETTGSSKTSNPGDGNLPSCDWAAVIACIKEVESTPSVGRANETDTASARGAALGVNRANETDTASAIFPKVVITTGLAISTNTAFNRGMVAGHGFSSETDTAFALTQGIVQLPVGRSDETDTAFKAGGIAMAPNRPIETDTAFQRSIILQVQRANEADTAFARARLGGVEMAIETDTAFALGKVFILPCGGPSMVANGRFDQAFLGDWVEFDADGTVVAGRLRATATADGDQDQQVRTNVTLVNGCWYRVTGQGFAGTEDAVVDFSSQALDPQINTAFDLVFQSISTLIQIQCKISDSLAINIGDFAEFDNIAVYPYTVETDSAFALNRLDTPAWSFSSETDTAFGFTVGYSHGVSTETDTAFALSGVFDLLPGRANEADTALALTAVNIRPVGFISETDTARQPGFGQPALRANSTETAFARNALVTYAIGMATETDTAFQMFGALEAGSGRKPHIRLDSILRDRVQPVHKTL